MFELHLLYVFYEQVMVNFPINLGMALGVKKKNILTL